MVSTLGPNGTVEGESLLGILLQLDSYILRPEEVYFLKKEMIDWMMEQGLNFDIVSEKDPTWLSTCSGEIYDYIISKYVANFENNRLFIKVTN